MFDDLGGLAELVKNYREAAVEVAKRAEVPLVDLNQLLEDSPRWLSGDGVHPSKEGCSIIAKHIGESVTPLLENHAGQSETRKDTKQPEGKTQETSE